MSLSDYASVPEQARRRLKIDEWLGNQEKSLKRIKQRMKDASYPGDRLALVEQREKLRIRVQVLRKVLAILRDDAPTA